jgi:DNA-binding NarL/FixJ family response regulator
MILGMEDELVDIPLRPRTVSRFSELGGSHALNASPVTAAPSVRVALVERQALFASAISTCLEAQGDLLVVEQLAEPDAGALRRCRPDVVLLDLDGQGSETADLIAACGADPGVPVCVMEMQGSAASLRRSLDAGALGYLVKEASPSQLGEVLRTLASGGTYLDSKVSDFRCQSRDAAALGLLSRREHQVVLLIAQGLANKEIGARLAVSEKTVKNHITHIFSKLNCNARTQAAVQAVRAGLL